MVYQSKNWEKPAIAMGGSQLKEINPNVHVDLNHVGCHRHTASGWIEPVIQTLKFRRRPRSSSDQCSTSMLAESDVVAPFLEVGGCEHRSPPGSDHWGAPGLTAETLGCLSPNADDFTQLLVVVASQAHVAEVFVGA